MNHYPITADKKDPYIKHSNALEIKAHTGNKVWNNYFVFTFVRNPWDLVLSQYYWWHKTTAEWNSSAVKQKEKVMNMSFTDFVKFIRNHHKRTMIYFLTTRVAPEDKNILNNEIALDFIGKFENLQDDFYTVCDTVNLPRIQLPNANPSFELRKGRKYTDFYTSETRDIIAELYKKDIEQFGYSFGD